MVACDQEAYESELYRYDDAHAVRLVRVPSFQKTGQIVLVDVTTPTLEVSCIGFQ
jgi:hypothetical protein